MKKTAMQELIELLNGYFGVDEFRAINFNSFLEREKQQIIDSVNAHDMDCIKTTNNVICKLKPSCKMLFEYDGKAGIEYYNKTFLI